jgi:hypothetical protein
MSTTPIVFGGERDITSSPFNVGDYVNVRCLVNSITGGQGAGGRVNLTVDTPGIVGQAVGVTLSVSPSQCRRSQGGISQPGPYQPNSTGQ